MVEILYQWKSLFTLSIIIHPRNDISGIATKDLQDKVY